MLSKKLKRLSQKLMLENFKSLKIDGILLRGQPTGKYFGKRVLKKDDIPYFIESAIEIIHMDLDVKDLFHCKGNSKDVDDLIEMVDQVCEENLTKEEIKETAKNDIHVVCNFLVKYFKCYNGGKPMFGSSSYENWLETSKLFSTNGGKSRKFRKNMQLLKGMFSPGEIVLFRRIFDLLHNIDIESKENRMTAEILSSMFSEIFIRQNGNGVNTSDIIMEKKEEEEGEKDLIKSLSETSEIYIPPDTPETICKLIQYFIKNSSKIF